MEQLFKKNFVETGSNALDKSRKILIAISLFSRGEEIFSNRLIIPKQVEWRFLEAELESTKYEVFINKILEKVKNNTSRG